MAHHSDIDKVDDGDLGRTADMLRAARIEPTSHELDRAMTTARKRVAAAPVVHSNGGFMRSKIAIISIVAMGFITSSAGVTFAFQGSSGQGSAAQNEYVPGAPDTPGSEDEDPGSGVGDETNTLGDDTSNSSDPSATAQEGRQVAANGDGDGDLPFTGLAAIPVILVGLGLLAAGLTLQRRNARELS